MTEENFADLAAPIYVNNQQPIQFRKLWNCCWGNEAAVIVFDGGERHAVCKSCANSYTGKVQWDLTDLATAFHKWIAEPREVGSVCYSGYWMEHYVVLNISHNGLFTVLWLNDADWQSGNVRVTESRTAWNPRRDKLMSVSMFDGLDDPESGGFSCYEEFMSVAHDVISNPTYVNGTY